MSYEPTNWYMNLMEVSGFIVETSPLGAAVLVRVPKSLFIKTLTGIISEVNRRKEHA